MEELYLPASQSRQTPEFAYFPASQAVHVPLVYDLGLVGINVPSVLLCVSRVAPVGVCVTMQMERS